jgi:DNA polymerase
LRGAIDVAALGGIDHLPRPLFASPSRHAPTAAPAPTPPVPAARPALAIVPADVDVAAAIARVLTSSAPPAERLAALREEVVGDCTRCKLHRGRSKLVFGVGNPTAELAFVGEGPGADEDRQGIPFVGAAGKLLTKMIEAMGKQRDDVYICNVVKCRPPNNRDPEPDEVEACEGFLKAQLAIVKPRVIVALGRYAAQTLLRTKTPITRLRGTWQSYEGIEVMPTYHPSYLLREPGRKREAWSDLQQVMKLLRPAAAASAPEQG